MAARFDRDYAAAGVRAGAETKRLLHAFDIELGRILRGKQGYQGTTEDATPTPDAKRRDARSMVINIVSDHNDRTVAMVR